ncbi:hypothetical protein [Paraburkholderia unamae]|nr:hypothetical protein [Paraburkholderia unamae]
MPELEKKLRLVQTAANFEAMLEEKLPSTAPDERAVMLENLAKNLGAYDSSLLQAVAAPISSPWPEAPKESIAGKLNETDRLLRIGTIDKAQSILDSLEFGLDDATPHEQAEYWYCRGRLATWVGNKQRAVTCHQKACELTNDLPRYVIAWSEAQLAVQGVAGTEVDSEAIKSRLKSQDPETQAMLARVLAAEAKFENAFGILARLDRTVALPTLGIIASMQDRHEDVVSLSDEGLAQSDVSPRHQQLFLILRARALFSLAMPADVRNAGDYVIAAWSGPATIESSLLQRSWNDIAESVRLLKEAGWPSNVEYIADIWGATALMLGRAKEQLQLAKEAATARPHLEVVQRALELIAVNVADYPTALAANERQPASSEQAFRRIGILHQAKAHRQCLETMEAGLDELPQDHLLYPVSLCLSVLSADRLLLNERVQPLLARLEQRDEWKEHLAVLKYFRAVGDNALSREPPLRELQADYHRLNRPLTIALQLFHVLDAGDLVQAAECVQVAERIREFQQISLEGEFQLAQAHVTLRNWSNLLAVADRAISKFDHIGRFLAIRALALDKLGLSSDALHELRRLLDSGVSDELATNTYVNIVTRSGFIDEALELVERLLGEETDRNRRLDCMRLLFNLLQAKEPRSKRAIDIAWTMGQLVDRNDEYAEGQFLSMFLTATIGVEDRGEPARAIEFNERLTRFVERWPDSKILRRGSLPENASGEDLMAMLKQVLGDPEAPNPAREKMVRQLSRGELPVPFSWRPRLVHQNVRDDGELWEMGKRSKRDAHQYHLQMIMGQWVERSFHELVTGIPLLDLTALFVLQDLELFDTLFAIFPKIAVSQALLIEIRERASTLANPWSQPRYARLVQELKNRFQNIQQPVSSMSADEQGPKQHLLSEDMSLLVEDGRYFIYSDDAALRLYVSKTDSALSGFCTFDLLRRADELELLTPKQIGEKLGLLCMWNVGIVITPRYLIASLPDSVGRATRVGQAVDAIIASRACSAILEGLWNIRKKYAEIATHVGLLLAALVANENNSLTTIAAIVGVWHGKAKLRTDAGNLTPVQRLALLIAETAMHPGLTSERSYKRLWEVYIAIVELQYGDQMDESKEKSAIETMAQISAELDSMDEHKNKSKEHGQTMRKGLPSGTADEEHFTRGYQRAIANKLNK